VIVDNFLRQFSVSNGAAVLQAQACASDHCAPTPRAVVDTEFVMAATTAVHVRQRRCHVRDRISSASESTEPARAANPYTPTFPVNQASSTAPHLLQSRYRSPPARL
jgi:hypothetical protein